MPPEGGNDGPGFELTAAIAADLIGEGRPRPEVTDVTRIDHWRGETCAARLADGSAYVVKLFPDVDPEQVRKEANVYRRIDSAAAVPVPEVIAVDADATRGPCPSFVMERVDGRHVDDLSRLSPDDRNRLFREIGAHYGRIHRTVTFDRFGLVGPTAEAPVETMATETWKEWLEHQLDGRLEALTESRFADLVPRAREFVDDRRSALDQSFEPVLLHDDYGPGNFLVAPDGDPMVRAVLDFERAIAGPAEHGVVKAEWSLALGADRPGSLREAFREGYTDSAPLPDAPELDERADLYRLEALLNEMLFTPVIAERGHLGGDEIENREHRIRTRFETVVEG